MNLQQFIKKKKKQYSTTSAFTSYMWFKSHLCAKSVQHGQLMKFVQRRTYTMWAWLKTPAFAYLPTGGKNVRCRQDTESSSRCALEPDSLHLRHSAERRRRRRRERRRESTEGGTWEAGSPDEQRAETQLCSALKQRARRTGTELWPRHGLLAWVRAYARAVRQTKDCTASISFILTFAMKGCRIPEAYKGTRSTLSGRQIASSCFTCSYTLKWSANVRGVGWVHGPGTALFNTMPRSITQWMIKVLLSFTIVYLRLGWVPPLYSDLTPQICQCHAIWLFIMAHKYDYNVPEYDMMFALWLKWPPGCLCDLNNSWTPVTGISAFLNCFP